MPYKHQEYMQPPTATLTSTPKITQQNINVEDYASGTINPIYQEINTPEGMVAINIEANIGKMYKYTGTTTSTYTNGNLYVVEQLDPTSIPLCFTANTAGSTIAMSSLGSPSLGQNFQYSIDECYTWTEFTPGTTTVTLTNIGDRVWFKGDNPNGVNESAYRGFYFVMTGSIAASGNIMSLIDNGACNTLAIPNSYCYCRIFGGCTALTAAPELPATTLAESCYLQMFSGTSIVVAPALPATILANYCYEDMFDYCSALTVAPKLSATTLATHCYWSMFYKCTSLVTPPVLPATSLTEGCYRGMFYGCTSLASAPALPVTTLPATCYYEMFTECTSLAIAPELPATIISNHCYTNMFKGCSSLTTIPKLPATTLMMYCYLQMFENCTSLYVSDTPITGIAEQPWTIPTSGVFANTYGQYRIFKGCAGTRSSDDMAGEAGQSYTYYTQNEPV